ncbi:MAG: mechanosensitive ion channel family protein [Thermotogota bacterium]|nr:mechanosensitive ion channel family protein [Thermotogota bacterium]
MIDFFVDFFISTGLSKDLSYIFANIISFTIILAIGYVSKLIFRKLVMEPISLIVKKTKNKWDNAFVERRVLDRLSYFVPIIIIYSFSGLFPEIQLLLEKTTICIMWIIGALVVSSIIDSAVDIYRTFEVSRQRPIKGYMQIIKIVVYAIAIIMIISILSGVSPLGLLGAIGAMSAVLILVFRDTLLGLVASYLITNENMVNIGDWISMPKYNADGSVIDISLHTVKVQNWDKTIVTIPIYAMVSDSFQNWKGMTQTGGRRIKRAVYIDMKSIKFCTEEMLKKFSKIQYIKDYIKRKKEEIEEHNKKIDVDTSILVNGRHLTNIGTFRAYLSEYLKNHPMTRKDMTLMVRQLAPTEHGIPIEIYAFSKDIRWEYYEGIQSDIFDHILAIVPEFELRVFQNPSGYDFETLTTKIKEEKK